MGIIIRKLSERTMRRLGLDEDSEFRYLVLFSLSNFYFLANKQMIITLRKHLKRKQILTMQHERELIENLVSKYSINDNNDSQPSLSLSLDVPVKATLLLTYRCNLSCTHCYLRSSPFRNEYLKYSSIIKFLDITDGTTLMEVDLSGGEPLTHPNFMDIIYRLKANNKFSVGIVTNGTLLNDNIISELKRMNIDVVQLSLESIIPEEHDLIRGKGNYKVVMDKINKLIKANIPVGLTITLNKINIHQLREYLAWARDSGIYGVRIGVLHRWGRAIEMSEEIAPSNQYEEYKLLYRAYEISKEFSNSLSITLERFPVNTIPNGCMALVSFAITPQEEIVPCDIFAQTDMVITHLSKISDLYQMWDDPKYKKIREHFNYNLRPCKKCQLFSICGSYCAAQIYRSYKNLFPPLRYFNECKQTWRSAISEDKGSPPGDTDI